MPPILNALGSLGIGALRGSVKINGFVAGVAQLVEQLIRNEKVEGSIPFTGTMNSVHSAQPSRWAFCYPAHWSLSLVAQMATTEHATGLKVDAAG